MKVHVIKANDFIPKGYVEYECSDNIFKITSKRSLPTQRFDKEHLSINTYLYLPDKYKLPLRIDITAKIDAPGFYVLLGKGHVNFGTLCSDNRRIDDIAAPSRKPAVFHNHLNMNEYTDISILYDLKEMQIIIGGEERYYSNKEKYMKGHALEDSEQEGFEFKIACDKMVNLWIKSVQITEYESSMGIIRQESELPLAVTVNNVLKPDERLTFEQSISLLPESFRDEIIELDKYLKAQKIFKITRKIEKNGSKITYVSSEYGFSYAIYLSNDTFNHSLQWYIITSGKPDTWHRKADYMEDTLNSLAIKTPEFAERMFFGLDDCVGCYNKCLARTRYQYKDKQKYVCHGKLMFNMSISGFEDVRAFVEEIKGIVLENEFC